MIKEIRRILKMSVLHHPKLRAAGESCQRFLWKHVPGLVDWRIDEAKIELDLTTRCSLACYNCCRNIRQAPSSEFMTTDQIQRFVNESIESGWRWRDIKLMGGEPTLHPHFNDVLDVLYSYKQANPECKFRLITNGHGERVRRVLSSLPEWVTVVDSNKSSEEHRFRSGNVAPIDLAKFKGSDYSRGCFLVEYCGMALTRYGYYSCGSGGAVDRVFGLDIGIKSISSLTPAALKDQMRQLCKYCGFYKYNYKMEMVTTEEISPTWRDAFERYRNQRPELTLY